MKNTIKNYIKIMGLAAVPFGTVQADGGVEYKIEVKKKETDKVRRFSIGVKCFPEENCFLRPEVIEIDWPKNNDAVPVRISKNDAKSFFRFCDVITKDDAALYYENKKLVQGLVHVLSFWGREFPFKSNDPFKEGLRCDLVFNPHPGGKQEEVLLVLERLKNFSCIVNVVSDIPTYMQGREGFMLITNHFCSFDKLPLFIGGGGFLRVGAKMTILLDNSVRQITDKEMRKSAKRFASLLIRSEGGHLVGPVAIGRTFIGRKEFRKEHSDCFKVYDAFSSDLIKDGKVYLSDFSKNKAISGISLLKMHNDTDGVIDYCRVFFY